MLWITFPSTIRTVTPTPSGGTTQRYAPALLFTVFAAACGDLQPPTDVPLQGPGSTMSAAQLEDVIVVFNDDVGDPRGVAQGLVEAAGGQLGHVYETALRGFSASLPPQAIDAVRRNPNVDYIESDGIVTASTDQANATWGIDRIDSPTGTDGLYTYDHDGSGVTVYIIDTGIRTSHTDFGGRALYGRDLGRA